MNIFTKIYARSFQAILYVAMNFLSFKEPELIEDPEGIASLPRFIKSKGKQSILLVADRSVYKYGLANPIVEAAKKENIPLYVYNEVVSNPTVDHVEEGLKHFIENKCDVIIAIGGGSAMDAAKMIAARAANPKLSVNKMKGLLKVFHKPVMLIAVPTTAGTGSETTVAAVIVDKERNDKYAVNDPKLIPPYAVLDPTLLLGLPGHYTAATGMDALTHAVEAYIGRANTKKTKQYARSAVKLIFENLLNSYYEPTNVEYRKNMQLASYQAGVAFTRAYVGNVHSLAHSIGGTYNVPHGLANAVILPLVLKKYGKSVHKKLAELADLIGVDQTLTNQEKSDWFIKQIEDLNSAMNITNSFGNLIQEKDLDFLVNHAYKESIPLYPTPRLLSKEELRDIYIYLKENN